MKASKYIETLKSIGKVRIQPVPPQRIGDTFSVSFAVKGSNVTYDVKMLGQHITKLSNNKKGESAELMATMVGIQRIDVEASNLVSPVPSKSFTMVIIENPVTNLKVKISL